MLDDLYPATPYNLGWPVFEGTMKKVAAEPEELMGNSLMFKDTLAPIYEYRHFHGMGGCAIGGYFLDHLAVYIFGDHYGMLRLLKEQDDGKWYEILFQQTDTDIWSLGYNQKLEKLFVSSSSKTFELILSTDQIKLLTSVALCRTTMPDGTLNNSGCD